MAVTPITADEVAAHLRVTRAWVLAEARAGRLAHYRLNRKVRFTWEQVEAFLADREARLAPTIAPGVRAPASRIPGALFPEGADPGGTVTAHHAAPPRAARKEQVTDAERLGSTPPRATLPGARRGRALSLRRRLADPLLRRARPAVRAGRLPDQGRRVAGAGRSGARHRPGLVRGGHADRVRRLRGALDRDLCAVERQAVNLPDYEGSIRNHLVPYFGRVELRRITREMIQRHMADKSASRKADGTPTWSPKTINGTMVPLREMLCRAVEWGYLDANPAASAKPLRVEPREREILTPAELAAVLEAAEGQHALMFRMAALLGLRRGELLGLRWGDLELDRRRLHVRQTYTNTGFGSPKTRAGRRVVPLTPGLVAGLRRHRLAAPPNVHDLVFASTAGTPIDPRNLITVWHRTLRRAGVRTLAFHSLRHTAVSLMIAREGLNPKQLQSVIGHASIQLTYDTYGHLMPDSFEGFGSGLDAALQGHGGVTGEELATTA